VADQGEPNELRSPENIEFTTFMRWLANLGYTITPPVNGAVLLKHRGRNIGKIWPSRTFVRIAAAQGRAT
jgi:hypothetical protein